MGTLPPEFNSAVISVHFFESCVVIPMVEMGDYNSFYEILKRYLLILNALNLTSKVYESWLSGLDLEP